MKKTALTALVAAAVVVFGIYLLKGPEGKVKIGPVSEPMLTMAAFVRHDSPQEIPVITFTDATDAQKDSGVFKGKVTLLNLWATWCAPCRKEMPELAKLQKELGGVDFQVVELSEDLKGYGPSAKFLKEVGADNLTLYADVNAKALDAVKAPGLPVTLLLNREGREVGRLIGPAPWASDEAKAIIEGVIESH
jgi:thiol-disulfide isomerase/thioredoxin